MSLSGMLTALVEYTADVIVNDCGRPVPTKVMRYHGTMPDACCTDDGVLSISWSNGYPSKDFPSRATDPCTGPPVYSIEVRYVTCWAGIDPSPEGVILPDDRWDTDAAILADLADCVNRGYLRLSCGNPDMDDPFIAAVFAQTLRNHVRWYDTTIVRPSGLCAGITWKLYAAIARGEAAS